MKTRMRSMWVFSCAKFSQAPLEGKFGHEGTEIDYSWAKRPKL